MSETDSPPEEPRPAATPEEPAPTALGRNIWLLVIIIFVVLLAWVLSLLWDLRPEPEPAAPPARQTRQPPQPTATSAAPPAQPVQALKVIGTPQRVILAAPPKSLGPRGELYRTARLFDVTRTWEAFKPERLERLPGRLADQFPVLQTAGKQREMFRSAAQFPELEGDDRIVVVRHAGRSRGYPVEILKRRAGVRDLLGGTSVFVCWSPFTQAPACLAAPEDEGPVDWRDAGLFYRGNNVYYDPATGSLWDGFSGAAIAGPRAGSRARLLPVEVWPLAKWREKNPDAPVLHSDAPGPQLLTTSDYLASPSMPVVLKNQPPATQLNGKAFVLGVSHAGRAKAYPLAEALRSGQAPLTDTVGEREITVHPTSPRTGYAVASGGPVRATVMLWFAWKELHPQTGLWSAPTEATPPPAQPTP